jgi:predicted RNA binding protein YcfA (HicA-like mRNA interferase family)
MACFKATKVKKALEKKGFEKKNGDHNYYEFWHKGKLVVSTKTSHNNQDIGDSLIGMMSRQVQLEKKQFLDLINCPLSKEDYIKILERKGCLS